MKASTGPKWPCKKSLARLRRRDQPSHPCMDTRYVMGTVLSPAVSCLVQ